MTTEPTGNEKKYGKVRWSTWSPGTPTQENGVSSPDTNRVICPCNGHCHISNHPCSFGCVVHHREYIDCLDKT